MRSVIPPNAVHAGRAVPAPNSAQVKKQCGPCARIREAAQSILNKFRAAPR